ncbi:MAG: hypothetical protein IJJ68_08470 [Prevotella sp.]|jgi:hypothetical protein|nr:hypothetical protein [Prevotella sp.]
MTEEKKIIFDYSQVTAGYQLCFLNDCPRRGECLRYMAGQHKPEKPDWGLAIYPSMHRDEQGCRFFQTNEPKHMAWGFDTIFEDVKSKHEASLRNAIKNYLGGHGTYYRYHRGERMLTPEQQEWIIHLFQKTGYQTNLRFDHYADVYDFDH